MSASPAATAASIASAPKPLVTATIGDVAARRRRRSARAPPPGARPRLDAADHDCASSHTTMPWRPSSPRPDATSSRSSHAVHGPDGRPRATPTSARLAAMTAADVEGRACPTTCGAAPPAPKRAAERVEVVGAELVAARVDARPDVGLDASRAPSVRMAATVAGQHAGGQPAPAGVGGADHALGGSRARRARSPPPRCRGPRPASAVTAASARGAGRAGPAPRP